MQEIHAMIATLKLSPHPEGGYYREIHRSETKVKTVGSAEAKSAEIKSAYTSIYFLLSGADFSSWHRIKSDETWFFHEGCDTLIHYFDENKLLQTIQLGPESKNFQATIAANTWFSAKPVSATSFCLVSCVVAPGFEFSDFQIGTREELTKEFGNSLMNIQAIEAFTRT